MDVCSFMEKEKNQYSMSGRVEYASETRVYEWKFKKEQEKSV